MTSVVRYGGLSDLNELAPLFSCYRHFYGKAPDEAGARHFLKERMGQGECVILYASNNSQPSGFILIYSSWCSIEAAPILILHDLYVDEKYRGQGVARMLMNMANRHAQSVGAFRIDLSTAHSNRIARQLYEEMGYLPDKTFLHLSRLIR